MKKYYCTPEAKFHQLRVRTSMLQNSKVDQGDNDEDLSKGFGSFYFDEDED